MGLLGWRGWDRLDELDRRTVFRRPWTETSVARTRRLMWALTALVLLSAVIDVIERHWLWAAILLATGVFSLFTNRRAIRNRTRTAGARPSQTGPFQ